MKMPFSGAGLLNEPTIKTALLAGLEKQLNAALKLDPVSLVELGKMAGVVVEVECAEPEFQCYVSLEPEAYSVAWLS